MRNYILKRLPRFFKRFEKPKKPEDLLEIVGLIGPIIDTLVMELFVTYSQKLLTEPITYIVPAVWGATKGGVLDSTQAQMHLRILPAVNKTKALLNLKGLRESQDFAIGFIIRGYIIAKVTYLVESLRNQVEKPPHFNGHADEFMINVKPLGTA